MRYCCNCGAPLDEDALFCPDCGTKVELPPVLEQGQLQIGYDENIQQSDSGLEEDAEDHKWTYICIGIVAAVLSAILGGWFYLHHKDSSNNPLGVQRPKWEKFVKVTENNVMLYKGADSDSPYLQLAKENTESCMLNEKMLWNGDKVPRGFSVENYRVIVNDVFPVVDENADFYKVYIGVGEIQEAYLQKAYCEEVKPEPITEEIIQQVKSKEVDTDYRFLNKGKFRNLYLEEYFDFMGDGETVKVGVLNDGCIVLPTSCCFYPVNADAIDTGKKLSENSAGGKIWKFVAPETYWKKGTFDMLDLSKLEESDIQKIVDAIRPSGNADSEVWYYFPTVKQDAFISFEYSFSPAMASNTEENAVFVTNYRMEDDENLIATIDGQDRIVDLNIGKTKLFEVGDLDGDGSVEAIVSHSMSEINGEPVDCPFVVYYDVESDTFKKTREMKLTLESIPTIEKNGDNPVIIQREGLRTVRYTFKDKKLYVVEDKTKEYGHIESKVNLDDIFGDDIEGEKIYSFAFLNGEEALLTFTRELQGFYHGTKMLLEWAKLTSGETINIDIAANSFRILKETYNGMPEILGDNFLYRWDGSSYVRYEWDGSDMIRVC